MSDIVTRLRDWRNVHLARLHLLMDEAADEIERLRADWPEQLTAHKVLIIEQELEIGRLRSSCAAAVQRLAYETARLLSRAVSDDANAGEEVAKCTVASAKLPDRERVANHPVNPDSSKLTAAALAPLKVDRIVLIVHHRNRDGLRFWASRLAESFACCERVSLPKGEDQRERLTAEEREAVEWFSHFGRRQNGPVIGKHAAALRGLLERLE